MKKKIYCAFCGKALSFREIEGRQRGYCEDCCSVLYENPLPVACAIVTDRERHVLLVKRARDPYKGMWCLPIGFAESGEHVQHAALRELKEEAGVEGVIKRLIDVDTVETDHYGSLAIVTYEIEMAGGNVSPGDDASDAAFFALNSLPPLAWSSNEKAIQIFIDLYRDAWSMIDSFRTLFPESQRMDALPPPKDLRGFLSNVLIQIIDIHIDSISQTWNDDLSQASPGLVPHIGLLSDLHKKTLKGIQFWLKRGVGTPGVEAFIETGRMLRLHNIPLADVLRVMALSRKALWTYILSKGIVLSPLEIYTSLEINNRIIFFYDKINYHLAKGYFA